MLPSLFVTLLALAAAPLAVVARSIQPPQALVRARPARVIQSRDAIAAERMTNAKRMSQGLPPLPPRRHRRGSPTIEQRARPSPSSAPGHTSTGYILATDAHTGKFVGFVGKQYELFGEYGVVKTTHTALKVSISGIKKHQQTGPVEIHQSNGDKLFTSVGAVSGFASDGPTLAANSSNYLYISGVTSTAPLAVPGEVDNAFTEATSQTEPAESSIWYLSAANKLSVKWVNPDGSLAKSQLAFYPEDNVLIVVGDLNAFKTDFGNASPVTLTFVSH